MDGYARAGVATRGRGEGAPGAAHDRRGAVLFPTGHR